MQNGKLRELKRIIVKIFVITSITLALGWSFLSFAKMTTNDNSNGVLDALGEQQTSFDWDKIVEITSDKQQESATEKVTQKEDSTSNNETTTVQQQTETKKEELKLPVKYDYRKIKKCPKVRNQGKSPYCWAYASVAAVESTLLPREKNKFSPLDMVDYVKKREDVSEGRTVRSAMSYLLSWNGPVSSTYKTKKHVQSVQKIEGKKIKKIKKLLYKYGGVTTSIYMHPEVMNSTGRYYNKSTSSLYSDKRIKNNHIVLIVGWDDNYSKNRFSTKPKKNGAFICMNSWGRSVGEKGFFYLSYEDKTFGKENACYTQIESNKNYDNIYQYDECGDTGYINYEHSKEVYFSNVFKARKTEKLKAIGFYSESKHIDYEVYVNNKFVKKKSLLKKATKDAKGYLTNKGYYTIRLNGGYNLVKGRKFCVTVRIKNKKGNARAPVEKNNKKEGIKVNYSNGQGYTSVDGIYWDSAEKNKYNVCLKAYTSNHKKSK